MRKRTNLDTSEANYLYASVLLKFNKNEKLRDLPIIVKNKLIDEVCERCIEQANENPDDIEALKFEVKAYKLTEEEREKSLSKEVYEIHEKPAGFNEKLKEKYSSIIEEEIEKIVEKLSATNNNPSVSP
jgi:hypothetical protein